MVKKLFFMALVFTTGTYFARAQNPEEEYNLKAAFVYNFTKYINWGISKPQDNFIIGVFGSSPILQPLEEIAQTQTVNGKKIIVLRFEKPEDLTFCNILYIPKNITFPLLSLTTRINRGTLTVSEQEGYAELGTAFNFVLVKDKLRFESNVKAINLAGLKASSQLLKLAIIVN